MLSIGNLTFGGTGKTPFVIYACRELARRGRKVAILSRGYKADGPGGNDEALVIRRHLPDVPHVHKHLQGVFLLEVGVFGQIHLAHTAAPQQPLDPVFAEHVALRKRSGQFGSIENPRLVRIGHMQQRREP